MILTFYDPETKKNYRLDGSDEDIKDVFWLEEIDPEGNPTEKYRRIDFQVLRDEISSTTAHFLNQKRIQDASLGT